MSRTNLLQRSQIDEKEPQAQSIDLQAHRDIERRKGATSLTDSGRKGHYHECLILNPELEEVNRCL